MSLHIIKFSGEIKRDIINYHDLKGWYVSLLSKWNNDVACLKVYEKALSVDNFPLWRKRITNDCQSHDMSAYITIILKHEFPV